MPLQNCVTPFSEITATSDRGDFMGNRGCLHDDQRSIVRTTCSVKRWITCLLEFKERRRTLMSPKQYTELFFLDEATALSAGHRPCVECRRKDYKNFRIAWLNGNPYFGLSSKDSIDRIDRILHEDRLEPNRTQKTFLAKLDDLPSGVMVVLPETGWANLWWHGKLYRWHTSGYVHCEVREPPAEVNVLTPRTSVNAIQNGYVPQIHRSIATESGL